MLSAQDSDVVTASCEPAPMRVLVAEDNGVNQLLLRTLLDQIGAATRTVGTGARAVAAWEAEPWDVILMDLHMPEMDGLAAAKAIRRREAETGRARTPIVALTAAAAPTAEALAAWGVDGFIPKPVEVGVLFDMLGAIDRPAPGGPGALRVA